ncbi:MAG TPA: OsmC family peroxiredoxin [Chloroflexi bacterium]|nr:OsmC family peroxiredoxin [Chloroflexota bacterium]
MSELHTAQVVLQEGMHFEGYPDEETVIHLDAAEQFGGQGKGTRPQKLLLVSLAGCTAMDVISILRKKRQEVSGLEVRVRAERADEHPKVYTHIWLTYVVTGKNVDPAAVERSIELSMTRYCPVAGLLRDVVPIETEYEIIEA